MIMLKRQISSLLTFPIMTAIFFLFKFCKDDCVNCKTNVGTLFVCFFFVLNKNLAEKLKGLLVYKGISWFYF